MKVVEQLMKIILFFHTLGGQSQKKSTTDDARNVNFGERQPTLQRNEFALILLFAQLDNALLAHTIFGFCSICLKLCRLLKLSKAIFLNFKFVAMATKTKLLLTIEKNKKSIL